MKTYIITDQCLLEFRQYLIREEKAPSTIQKYMHDLSAFWAVVQQVPVTKEMLVEYKRRLSEQHRPSSVNSVLAALNHFFRWCGWQLHVKALKIQQQVFCDAQRELTKPEYERLLRTAQKRTDKRSALLLQTLASTGIRVSELRYITVEAVKQGRAEIHCKGKDRSILLPPSLCKLLLAYAKTQKRASGPIFVTRTGRLLNRSNIWRMLQSLCKEAGVEKTKVFPHNLRHLFARVFYRADKDIAKLADVLGHSSINTTRIYMISSGEEHTALLESLGFISDTT